MPTARNGDASIYYESHGSADAPALVFAHGAGGNRLSWWQQVPEFAARYRVITFDHRSFGRSRCGPEGFATRYFAGDLLAVLDAEGIARASLVCQSMGGWTGLATTLAQPERVACLVLCDTPGGLFSDEIARALASTGQRISEAGIDANAALAPDFPQRSPAMAHLYAQISALNTEVDPGALAALAAPEARIDPGALTEFATPTLVVAGEHDLLFPLETLRHVAELVPGADFQAFSGCGHSVYFEDAEAFNREVGRFVARFA
jgi:3-oxoadipate enol-lactonase